MRDLKSTIFRWLLTFLVPRKVVKHPWDEDRRKGFFKDLEIAEQWINTFPVTPDFLSKKVVEIGCGYGALCVQVAKNGAQKVLGVELDRARAEISRDLVYEVYHELKDKIDFIDYESLESLSYDEQFDIILSQNAFEHYEDPERVLKRMAALLKPGGLIFVGFGPLWNSPFGSHLKASCPLPWGHLWAEELVFREHNRLRPHAQIASWRDIGVNQGSLVRYEKLFYRPDGCTIKHFRCNQSIRYRSPIVFYLLEILRAIPPLREYLTASLFIVLEKS